MREQLKNLQLRLTELSEYLDISRPTLYKFVEQYDAGEADAIKNEKVVALFNYITKNNNITKKEVIAYIASGKMSKGGKEFSFTAKPKTPLFNLLQLVQTYASEAYDENNYSTPLGRLLLFMNDASKDLTEEEKERIAKIIAGGSHEQ